MTELNTAEIETVDGGGKFGLSLFGVTAGVELSQDKGLALSADVLGFPLFALTLPI